MRFREDRSQDYVTITSKPFERVFCVVAMQKSKHKSFDFKKMPYQDDLSDESKARIKMNVTISSSLYECDMIHFYDSL